eukprot:362084_1
MKRGIISISKEKAFLSILLGSMVAFLAGVLTKVILQFNGIQKDHNKGLHCTGNNSPFPSPILLEGKEVPCSTYTYMLCNLTVSTLYSKYLKKDTGESIATKIEICDSLNDAGCQKCSIDCGATCRSKYSENKLNLNDVLRIAGDRD